MSNGALDDYLKKKKIKAYRTKIGDRYVSEAMGKHKLVLGGEQSGHIIYNKYANTGDGLVAALQVLSLLITQNMKASEIKGLFNLKPQTLKNVKYCGDNPLENKNVKKKVDNIIAKHKDKRILVRKSGTEALIRIMVEGSCKEEIKKAALVIEAALDIN